MPADHQRDRPRTLKINKISYRHDKKMIRPSFFIIFEDFSRKYITSTQNSISFQFYIHFITIKSTTYAKFGKTAKIFRPLYFDKIFCEKRRNLHWKKFSCLYNNLEIFVIKPRGSLMILNIGQKRTFRECRVNFSNFLTNRRTKL